MTSIEKFDLFQMRAKNCTRGPNMKQNQNDSNLYILNLQPHVYVICLQQKIQLYHRAVMLCFVNGLSVLMSERFWSSGLTKTR